MQETLLNLKLLDADFGIVKLDPNQKIPDWVFENDIYSITQTGKEITVVCPHNTIPQNIKCDKHWKCIVVEGSLDFNEVGIIAAISNTLSQNGISIYVISSFYTDYFLIKDKNVAKAVQSLRHKGHTVS